MFFAMPLRFTQLLRQFVVVVFFRKEKASLPVKLLRQCEEKIHLTPLSSVVVHARSQQSVEVMATRTPSASSLFTCCNTKPS